MEKKMRFNYSNKQKKTYLILGAVTLLLSSINIFLEDNYEFLSSLTGLGVLYFLMGIYYWKAPYLKIENGIISKHEVLVFKRNLDEIKKVKRFTDEFTFKTEDKELTVNYNLMSTEDQKRFFEFVERFQEKLGAAKI